MKHVVCFSGGKDSTALVLWAKENLPQFTTVFCDTGWEHPITYAYIDEINATVLGGSLVVLQSAKYPSGMRVLVEIKKRVPSAKARFCTEALKTDPMAEYLRGIDDEVLVYQGIRRDESLRRSQMCAVEFSDVYDCEIRRPLFHWSAEQCFDLARKHGIKPNPLYLMGAARVGCFPCVMIQLRELKALFSYPEMRESLKGRIIELEGRAGGRSFFPPNYIPHRFQTGFDSKSGKRFPKAEDVFAYVEKTDADQMPMLEQKTCMSVYNLCE